ncbi:MAG: PIN domain-containing protein [Anaerolineales bacterium]|jgi:predicted nucleic acid-binding protein
MSVDNLSFLDTNILIYAFDTSTSEKHQKASKLFEELWVEENGCVSIQVLQEFYVNVTRKALQALEPEQAATIIRDLSNWKVHRPVTEDVLAAISIQQKYQISFWDAMIIRSAKESNCKILYSEDLSNGQNYGGVKVSNPLL